MSAQGAFSLLLADRQRLHRFDLAFIRRMALLAHPACLTAALSNDAPLCGLREVEATILSDRRIGRVHAEFFDDPSPTDVITFHHGEILLGAGVVLENAALYGRTPDEEAALCVIHGMLHLAGWDDLAAGEAKKMATRQEHIFKQARRMV